MVLTPCELGYFYSHYTISTITDGVMPLGNSLRYFIYSRAEIDYGKSSEMPVEMMAVG